MHSLLNNLIEDFFSAFIISWGSFSAFLSETASIPDASINVEDESSASAPVVVRGRVKGETKAMTFNQLWTVDEQKRLEELLIKYPPEEVEARRWNKIATALGNRTTAQVRSVGHTV